MDGDKKFTVNEFNLKYNTTTIKYVYAIYYRPRWWGTNIAAKRIRSIANGLVYVPVGAPTATVESKHRKSFGLGSRRLDEAESMT